MPYNVPPTFFVPGTWEAGSSNSYKERMEKKYEKNNGRNSDWYDDRGKDDNTGTTATTTSTSTPLTSTSSSERSAWHPIDNSYTKTRNQNNINNEDNLLSNNNDVGEDGSNENGRYNSNNDKNNNINNNMKNESTDNRKSNVQYATNQVRTDEKGGTANTEILIDIKQILEMEKAKKQAKKFKKTKVATYWEENPELTGSRYSNAVRQGGDGIGVGVGVGVDRVGEDRRLVSRSSAEQGERSGLTARQSGTTFISPTSTSPFSFSSFSTSATTSLSTSTLKRVESCESFYLSVYFYFPHLRAFLILIKNDMKKKRKKSGNRLEKDKIVKICDTDFKFHGNGHQILWKILEKMEIEMSEGSDGVEEGGEGGKSLTPVPIKSDGIFDANSFLEEVEFFISNPDEYFHTKKISNDSENEISVNVNENENNESVITGVVRGSDHNVNNNNGDSDKHRQEEKEREKSSDIIRDRLDGVGRGREKNNNRDSTSINNNKRDSDRDGDNNINRGRERSRREYASLSASALEMIQGKKVLGKSKLSIEFAIQDGQRIVTEYEARKEQIELLSKFRTESIQNRIPLKNTETVTSNPENTEIQNANEKRIFLTEESFNSENVLFNTLEDWVLEKNLDANTDVSEHAQQISVGVSSVSSERSREGDSRGTEGMTITNLKSSLSEKEVEEVVTAEVGIGLEEYLEQLLIVEQRTSSLSQERAERSSSLWEDYTNRVRNNRIDGISDEPTRGRSRDGSGGGEGQREGEGVERDGGEEGDGEGEGDVLDSITMQDTEMLFYLQSPDDTDTLDNNHHNNNNDAEDEDDDEGDDEDDGRVLEKGYTKSQYAFDFDGDAGAILEEGAYMDEREKDQVIESRARKSSGKYRSVLWSALSYILLQSWFVHTFLSFYFYNQFYSHFVTVE